MRCHMKRVLHECVLLKQPHAIDSSIHDYRRLLRTEGIPKEARAVNQPKDETSLNGEPDGIGRGSQINHSPQ